MSDIETQVTDLIVEGLTRYDDNRERSVQSREGGLGMSDLGFCRQKATLQLRGTQADERVFGEGGIEVPNWAANVGSAIHNWLDEAFRDDDAVVLGSEYGPVSAEFPSSRTVVSGHFDLAIPSLNLLLDAKTKNRLEPARREGVTQNNVYQRHAYAMGAVAAGLLRDDGTLKVGNLFLDRSGKDKRPWVQITDFDPTLTHEIDQWLEDVVYAWQHNEDASRDVPATMCPYFCEFFDTCRGGVLEDTHDPTLITDPDQIRAVQMYLEGQDLARRAKDLQGIAKPILAGANGRAVLEDVDVQVRWTHVQASEFTRSAYDQINVKRMKRK